MPTALSCEGCSGGGSSGRIGNVQGLEEQLDPLHDSHEVFWRKAADLLNQIVLVDGEKLGNVDHAPLRETSLPCSKQNVPAGLGTVQVGGQAADDDRADGALVEEVVLNHDIGSQEARA